MKKLMMVALAAGAAAIVTGCQTRITATKNAEVAHQIQEVVKVNGEDQVITRGYQVTSGGWEATARSPLWASETLKGLEIGVTTNGSVTMSIDKYGRDLSTNAVTMTKEMFSGGAQLATAIGDAYVKIAGGGAQADTALSVTKKIISYFTRNGGDTSKATVTAEDGKVKVTDGTTCVSCDKDGNCTECTDCTVTDGGIAAAAQDGGSAAK